MATSTTHSGHLGLAATPRASGSWLRASQRLLGRDWITGWLFVLPMVLLLFGLIGYPFGRAVWLSLHNAVGVRTGDFVGLQNYANLWADDFFLRAVSVTILFTIVCVALKFLLGLGTALLIHHVPRWGAVLGGLALLPYIIPDTVKALAWRVLLDPLFGAMNYILVNVLGVLDRGLPWLGDPDTALWSVILIYVWSGMPFFVILFLAGLKAVDSSQYEAAAVDGANAWRRFLHVTLPGLRYVILVAVLLATIFTFNSFTTVYLLTGGGPGGATRIYTILAYEYAVQGLRYGAGTAVAMTVAPLLFVLILYLGRYMMGRGEAAPAEDGGPVWHVALALLWPFRLLGRLALALFWAVNDAAERLAGTAARAVRPAGARPLLPRAATRRVGHGLMYGLLGAILLFELLPFYFIFVTSFKSTLQIQQIESMFWPAPWTLDNFRYLLTEIPFTGWYMNTITVAVVSTAISVFVASLGAYGLVRLQ